MEKHPVICINSWWERLGNNLIQLHNAILIALYYNYNLNIPPHQFLNKTYIKIHDGLNGRHISSPESNNFFFRHRIKNIHKELFTQNNVRADIIVINRI